MLTSLCTADRFDHDPCRLQQWECDEADHSRYDPRVIHVPPEQSCHRRRDESSQPVADGDLSEQDAGAQDMDGGAAGQTGVIAPMLRGFV
jgi:hypothetical protein